MNLTADEARWLSLTAEGRGNIMLQEAATKAATVDGKRAAMDQALRWYAIAEALKGDVTLP